MDGVLETIAVAFAIGLTGALAPGPTLVATINSSLREGWTSGLKISAGHAAVEAIVFLLIIMGLRQSASIYETQISLIGGLALIIFGILTAKNAKHAKLSVSAGVVMAGPTMSGAITSAANPYFWIWWLSVGSALVLDGLSNSILIAVAFMIGHWGADFGWYMLVSASVAKGRTILTPFAYRYALFICGVFLILFGVYYLSRTFA